MDVPFRIGQRVTGEFFTDRRKEVSRIRHAMSNQGRLLVYGERRQGKSSAMQQAARRVRRDGGLVLWADVSTASGFGDIARRLIAGVPWKWRWREELLEALARAQLLVEARTDAAGNPVLGLGLLPRPMDPGHGLDELRRVVAVLDRLTSRNRAVAVAVVLDEFQEVVGIQERGEWILRDIIQGSGALAFVCAGSRRGIIDGVLAPAGAFHRFFEPLAFGPMDPRHLATWIESRIEQPGIECERGVGREIVTLVGGRTEDAVRLARAVFLDALRDGRAETGGVATALARAALEDHHRYQHIWNNLARSQQAVLRALASGERRLYGREARELFGLTSPGTIRNALNSLEDASLLAGSEEPGIDDPYFRQWILLRAMPGGTGPSL
jgi:hypothetical protein